MAASDTYSGHPFGRFEILREMRADAPYRHWLAREAGAATMVEISVSPGANSLTVSEALAANTRPSPEILPYLEQGTLDDLNYTVVPHRNGHITLADCSHPDRLLRDDQIVPVFMKVARALNELHRTGIVHGVLTPASVILHATAEATSNHATVSDYVRLRLCHGGINYYRYAAPEICSGGSPTSASDVFSLGAILFEVVTGRLPNSRLTMPVGTTPEQWPLLRHFRAGVSAIVERAVHKALHSVTLKRYRNVLEFAADLSLSLESHAPTRNAVSAQGIFIAARSLDCFDKLTNAELWQFVRASRWLRFDSDELLANSSNESENLYAVVAGTVAQFEKGRLVANLGVGSCFGAQCLVKQSASNVYYASAGTTLLAVPATAVEQMTIGCQLSLHQHLLQQLSYQLRKATMLAVA